MEKHQLDFLCPVCGKQDFVPSVITFQANYGSIHDGEQVSVYICGDCLDRLLSVACLFGAAVDALNA